MKSYKSFISEGWRVCPRCGGKTRHEHEFYDNEGNNVDRYRCTMCKQVRDAKRKKPSAKKQAHKAKMQAAIEKLLKDD